MATKSRLDLGSEIVQKIKELIFTGELSPGQQIRQNDFAEQLGVSRTPLLHALKILESEMLVENFPNRGVFVRQLSLKELGDIFEYREAVESMACRLAAQRVSDDEMAILRALFNPFIKNPAYANIRDYQQADQSFHRLLIKFSGNAIFPRMMMMGNVLISAYQKGLIRPPVETLPEHLEIIDQLENRDAEQAENAMREHLRISTELISAEIEKERG